MDKDIGFIVKKVMERVIAVADARMAELNITFPQSLVLRYLNRNGGRAPQKEIESYLGISHAATSGIISRMEQNGHITTCVSPQDRRNKIVTMSPETPELLRKLDELKGMTDTAMLSGIAEENLDITAGTLEKIYDNLLRTEKSVRESGEN